MVGAALMLPAADCGRPAYEPAALREDEPGRTEPATDRPPPWDKEPWWWAWPLNCCSAPGGSENFWPSWRVTMRIPGRRGCAGADCASGAVGSAGGEGGAGEGMGTNAIVLCVCEAAGVARGLGRGLVVDYCRRRRGATECVGKRREVRLLEFCSRWSAAFSRGVCRRGETDSW